MAAVSVIAINPTAAGGSGSRISATMTAVNNAR